MNVPFVLRATLAASAVATLMAAPAHAAVVVYSGPPISITNSIDGLYLNVISGSQIVGGAGWDLNIYNNGATTGSGLRFWQPTGGGYIVSGSAVSLLAPGTVIGPGGAFSSANVAGGFTAASFEGTTGFFGFRFVNEATGGIHYGWGQLQATAGTGFPATLISYAYENVANTAITVVPEPGTYALMLAGLAGVAGIAARRRKAA